ncbi:unnamed protein product [Durusdinium trenchii]|uniref:Uncharacterized protein n=1 Tax=Durusdinium trenchii TaxID=1381693 RepID=A0ABP0PGU9_9DINO
MSNLRLPRIEHCALSPGFKHCSPEDGLLNTTSPSVFQPLGRCHPDPSSLWSEESGFCSTPPWCPLRCKVGGAPGRDVGRLEMESGHAATVQCEARSSQRMEEGRLTFVEESLTSFKEQVEQQRKAQEALLEMQLDAARRELEQNLRAVKQQKHEELLQDAERVALAAVSRGVREALATEVASLHRSFKQLNDSVDERLRIFEQRLERIEDRSSKNIDEVWLRMEQLEWKFHEDGHLSPEVAKQVPSLVTNWGQGKFPSQSDLLAYLEHRLTEMQTVKAEIHEMLQRASDGLGDRVEECVVSKTQNIENRLMSTDMMLRNLLTKQKEPVSPAVSRTPSGAGRSPSARDKGGSGANRPDSAGKPQLELPGSPKSSRSKGSRSPKAASRKASEKPSNVSSQSQGLVDEALAARAAASAVAAGAALPGVLEGADLLSWLKSHVNELLDLKTAAAAVPRDSSGSAMDEERPEETQPAGPFGVGLIPDGLLDRLEQLEQSLEKLAVNIKELDGARLPGRMGTLESQCLDERLALLESYAPSATTGAHRPPSRPSSPSGATTAQTTSQLLALREEMQRLKTRVGILEGLTPIQDLDASPTSPASPAREEEERQPNSHLLRSEDFKHELMNLWHAIGGDQKNLDLLTARLEDAKGQVARMTQRFDTAMPQMLQLLGELLRGQGFSESSDEVDLLLQIQQLLYGESGMPFVSPAVLRETFQRFEALLRSEMEKLREELVANMEEKARSEDLDFLAEQLRLWQNQLQILWQTFEKLTTEQEVDAAIWRKPLAARCVSCDRKVDIKGLLFDRDTPQLPTGANSPSPERHLVAPVAPPGPRATSARRGGRGRNLPAIDA